MAKPERPLPPNTLLQMEINRLESRYKRALSANKRLAAENAKLKALCGLPPGSPAPDLCS